MAAPLPRRPWPTSFLRPKRGGARPCAPGGPGTSSATTTPLPTTPSGESVTAGAGGSDDDVVVSRGRLVGFIDWDFAAPCLPLYDLAFVVFSWVPMHAHEVVAAEGFSQFADRPRRLRLLLDGYGYTGTMHAVLEVVRERVRDHASGLRDLAAAGDPLFIRLVDDGVIDGLDLALAQLDEEAAMFEDGA